MYTSYPADNSYIPLSDLDLLYSKIFHAPSSAFIFNPKFVGYASCFFLIIFSDNQNAQYVVLSMPSIIYAKDTRARCLKSHYIRVLLRWKVLGKAVNRQVGNAQ